jgi:glycerol-3-phosphate O-acyltransferase / dihydroxyacetone phosphate acyltransferase
MLYSILKVIVGFSLRIFYRKIHVSGLENIDAKKPQIIASNHPNGFMEPLVMACYFPRPLHFLVRGDVFDKKWLRPLLLGTNQIPVFRFKDGFSKLRENAKTFDASTKVLMDNNMLLIYAEGGTESIKKLRPLQKGVARLAFQVLEADPNTPLEILPSGINFTYPQQFNSEVMLSVGKPILIQDYKELHTQDPKEAMDKLLDDLFHAMKPHVVHLEDQAKMESMDQLLNIKRAKLPQSYLPVSIYDRKQLDEEIKIANWLNVNNSNTISSDLKLVRDDLMASGYTYRDLSKSSLSVKRALVLMLGLIPALLGYITHAIPLYLGKTFAHKKVTSHEFLACIWMAVTIVFILIYYMMVGVFQATPWLPWFGVIILFGLGLWARWYYDYFQQTIFRLSPTRWSGLKNRAFNILNQIQ